jgi:hypothetical protein
MDSSDRTNQLMVCGSARDSTDAVHLEIDTREV